MTRWRIDSRTFGSLLRTRETVFFDVPATRATSLMVARFMRIRSRVIAQSDEEPSARFAVAGICRAVTFQPDTSTTGAAIPFAA